MQAEILPETMENLKIKACLCQIGFFLETDKYPWFTCRRKMDMEKSRYRQMYQSAQGEAVFFLLGSRKHSARPSSITGPTSISLCY
jgi:hypothetical protein